MKSVFASINGKKWFNQMEKHQTVFFALWDSVDRFSFQGTSKHRYMIMFYPLKCRVSIRFCPETIQVHVAVWSPFSNFWWIIWRPLGVISSWRKNEWECHKTTHVMKRPWDHAIHTQQKKVVTYQVVLTGVCVFLKISCKVFRFWHGLFKVQSVDIIQSIRYISIYRLKNGWAACWLPH